MKRGKKYQDIAKNVDKSILLSPAQAFRFIKENAAAKFDESVEVHLRLGVDPRKADQQVRGTVGLPHGTGKKVRVAVFAQGDKQKEAEEAGAEVVGGADLAEKIEKGWLEFDVSIATPDMMSVVGKLGRILGPRGLMPNPKSGTVTFDVGKAVSDIQKGKVEYRVDKYGIIHAGIGKVSFSLEQLIENYGALLEEIVRAKPSAAKGKYLKTISVASTMGPAVRLDPTRQRDLLEEEAAS